MSEAEQQWFTVLSKLEERKDKLQVRLCLPYQQISVYVCLLYVPGERPGPGRTSARCLLNVCCMLYVVCCMSLDCLQNVLQQWQQTEHGIEDVLEWLKEVRTELIRELPENYDGLERVLRQCKVGGVRIILESINELLENCKNNVRITAY